jgi:hypothetical protein
MGSGDASSGHTLRFGIRDRVCGFLWHKCQRCDVQRNKLGFDGMPGRIYFEISNDEHWRVVRNGIHAHSLY